MYVWQVPNIHDIQDVIVGNLQIPPLSEHFTISFHFLHSYPAYPIFCHVTQIEEISTHILGNKFYPKCDTRLIVVKWHYVDVGTSTCQCCERFIHWILFSANQLTIQKDRLTLFIMWSYFLYSYFLNAGVEMNKR